MPIEQWAKKLRLNPDSSTTQQLYDNRHLTVIEYIAKFRKGSINEVLPSEAKAISVEEALEKRFIGGINIRKLLASGREKFKK
jgi:hypothetical protein